MMISIIDYGGGNVASVKNALDFLSIKSIVTDDIDIIRDSEKIILPGQGRFGEVMKTLRRKILDKVIIEEISKGKPYLGICIGLQILFEKSGEDPGVKGLGLLKGDVKRFQAEKVPQIGWNKVRQNTASELMKALSEDFFYFIHSYFVDPEDKGIVLTTTYYGLEFVSAVQKNNILGVQFHPEKSGETGLKLLKNFCEIKC